MKAKTRLLSAVFLSSALLLGGCAQQKQSAAVPSESKEVNVYTARHYPDVDDAIYKAFTDKTGIKVNLIKASGEELIQRLKTEGAGTKADLFFTADAGNLHAAKEADLLQPFTSPLLEKNIPADLRDKDNAWTGLTMRARILVYAKDRVNPAALTSYEDLTKPEWQGKVLVRSSGHIYNQSMLASFIALNGEENAKAWASGLVANLSRKPEGGDRDQAKAIAAGVGDVAIMNSYYLGQMLLSKDPAEVAVAQSLGVIFPNQATTGTHINVSGAGLVKHAKNAGNATKLLEFLSEPNAQQAFAEASAEYPANPSVAPSAVLKGWGDFKRQTINLSKLGENNKKAVQLFNESGWK